jgi:RNA polymerase sigma factor (sigma-70 family)
MKPYTKEFIKQLKRSDRAAQKQVFGQLYAPMFRVCNRYVVQVDEAEDCLMKGFMKVFQHMEKFEYKDEQSLFWWIRRIMVNEALMMVRKKNNFNMMTGEDLPEISVEASVWSKLDAEDLNRLIMRLPTGYRTIFSLYVVEGYPHKEIAEMLDISESTSKTQLAKAKQKLKQFIEQTPIGYGTVG